MDKNTLVGSIESYVDEVWDDVLDDIAALVAIPSVEDMNTAAPGAPWGTGPRRALDEGLAIARRLGLEPHDLDGYIGYADLSGDSSHQLATIAHLDVVPAGDGWATDPFSMMRHDGYLLGRGVLDDKGPAAVTLWAAHYFVRRRERPPYTLRILLGVNEETGMGDVGHYLANNDEPSFLFTPDAEFPVVCGEKGCFNAELSFPVQTDGSVIRMEGGTAQNAIPSAASALVRAEVASLPTSPGITFESAGTGLVRIQAAGRGGHAALPQGTVNAFGVLFSYLRDNMLFSASERSWVDFEDLVFSAYDGSLLGIAATDDVFDPLTCISGTFRMEGGAFVQSIDCRYPKSTNAERIAARLGQTASDHGVTMRVTHEKRPFFVDPDSDVVQALLGAYNEFTGSDARPMTIGGGTYARRFSRAAGFGPVEPDAHDPEWVGQMHGPNEGISEELLRQSLKMDIYAIARLMELEL